MTHAAPLQTAAERLVALLDTERDAIVDETEHALARLHAPHYDAVDAAERRARLRSLLQTVRDSVATGEAVPAARFGADLAHRRYEAGVALGEVQCAFNVLEEAIWVRIVATARTSDALVEEIGLLTSVLGVAKDALARAYVELASEHHAPAVDVERLSTGLSAT